MSAAKRDAGCGAEKPYICAAGTCAGDTPAAPQDARGMVGGALGAVGMAIAAVAMSLPPLSVFEVHWLAAALLGGAVGAVVAALIGFGIGSATGHQVQQEYEAMIHSGGQLLAVNTDSRHAGQAFETLSRLGGSALSTSVHRKHHTHQSA